MKGNRGFTLIELLVTIALAAVLATVGFVSISGYRSENHLKDEASKITTVLQNARQNSISQLGGAEWGVHFLNGTSSDIYQQFSGASSFASGTPGNAYSLGYGLSFGNPATSSEDVVFNPLTGTLPNDATVNLIPGQANGMSENIIVSALGAITARFETGLVGYWPMDEGVSSTAYDASGYGNNGIATSTSWQPTCKVGNCLNFNGASAYVQLSNLLVNTASGGQNTVTFWMDWNGATGGRMPFGFSSPYDLEMTGSNFGFNTSCSDLWQMPFTSAQYANKWVFVAAIFVNNNATSSQLYINGVQQTLSQSGTPCSKAATASARIGYWPNGGTYYFSGYLDDFRIYNRALSAQEIQDLYNAY